MLELGVESLHPLPHLPLLLPLPLQMMLGMMASCEEEESPLVILGEVGMTLCAQDQKMGQMGPPGHFYWPQTHPSSVDRDIKKGQKN